MIESLKLKNFKSHKDSELVFSTGVNIIKGTSHHGKSNIVRAFRWIIENRPSGDSPRNWHTEDETSATLVTTDGHTISRIKSEDRNSYIVDKQPLDCVSRTVPEIVKSILNFGEANLQNQFNPYFLLLDSPRDRAKAINKIFNIDIIDQILKELQSEEKRYSSKAKMHQQAFEEAENQLLVFSPLEAISERYHTKTFEFIQLEEDEEELQDLEITIPEIELLTFQVMSLQDFQPLVGKSGCLFDACMIVKRLQDNYMDISRIVGTCEKYQEDLKILKDVEKYVNSVKSIEAIASEVSVLQKTIAKLTIAMEDIERLEDTIGSMAGQLLDANEELETLLSQLPNKCPTCGSIIK